MFSKNSTTMKYLYALCFFLSTVSLAIGQGNGPLDTTFANNGEFSISYGNSNEAMSGVALLDDGRIISAGASEISWKEGVRVAMLLPDGNLDVSFGTDGVLELPESDFGYNYSVYAFAVPDGDIMIITGGLSSGFSDRAVVWKFSSDGVFDLDFGTDGILTIPEFSLYWFSMTPFMDADGKIYITGIDNEHPLDAPGLALIDPNGAVDFDFALEARFLLQGEYLSAHWKMRRMMDGGWMLFGYCYDADLNRHFRMVMATGEGEIDSGFGNDGLLTNDIPFSDVMGLNDGSVLILNSDVSGDLFRLTPQGNLDLEFGNAGYVDLPSEFDYQRLHRDLDGNILVWGSNSEQDDFRYFFSRLDSSGIPYSENSGSPDGEILRFLYPPSLGQLVNQPDGKILLSSRSPINEVPGVKAYIARIDPQLIVGIQTSDNEANTLLVSPNPCIVGERITLEGPTNWAHEAGSVKLYSMVSGQWIDVRHFIDSDINKLSFDLPEFSGGVYFIQVETTDKVMQVRLVVVD